MSVKIGKYRINSSVVMASAVAFLGALVELLSSGWVVGSLADIILFFLDKPETFKPFLTDRIYQGLLTFLPLVIIILRNTNVRYRPPIEKVDD